MSGIVPTKCYQTECLRRGEYMKCFTEEYENCKGYFEIDSPVHDVRDRTMTKELLEKLRREGL